MMSPKVYMIGYLCVINMMGFVLMGLDKWKAKHKKWRIAERTLFLVGIVGGSPGCWLGMYIFRHKTKHWQFVVGMPAILVIQAAVILFLTSKI
ncbi:MAG: DUF1294 domain-containing protein [Lachnospiraceae bacterium]|jgi:Predicted membrane protein|nr:DUF1294 domain-containing protein [Lachnospiraceae bacterium]